MKDMTEEEANAEIVKRVDKRHTVFCPLIKDGCRTDCEFYLRPYKGSPNFEGKYLVGGSICEFPHHGEAS